MNYLQGILNLVRWVNLLYILVVYLLFRYCLLLPLYNFFDYQPSLTLGNYLVFTVSVMCIAAAGYIINDYFDVEADIINKPNKVYVTKLVSKAQAFRGYVLLNVLGVALGFYCANIVGHYQLAYIHIVCAALLWFYATTLKRIAVIGNVLVAGLTAFSILLIGFFEFWLFQYQVYLLDIFIKANSSFTLLNTDIVIANESVFSLLLQYLYGFTAFAFLLNLAREFIKDVEDVQGDTIANYKTLAIVGGKPISKLLAAVCCLLTFYFLFKIQMAQVAVAAWVSISLIAFFMQLPLLYLVYLVYTANTKKQMHSISTFLKVLMLVGILYLPYLRTTIYINANDSNSTQDAPTIEIIEE